MGSLSLKGVNRDFGGHKGVFDVNIEVEKGEFFVILGPSGCGKTTTLRMIAGLESVDEGNIFLDDREITNFPPRMRNIAMVFQNYALYPFMTVRQNIQFPLKIMKMSKTDMEAKTEEVSKMLGISDLLDRKPGEISGGQRQRVALGRALVREPALFLMDEPLSNLDAKLRTQMRVELKRLQKEFETTTVYVTHDQVEATTLADRACLMNEGKVVQIGQPLELYNVPANTFVGTFVGDPPMNVLPAKLVESNGETLLHVMEHAIPMGDVRLDGVPEREITVGIRPEDLLITEKGIPARLAVLQNVGKSTYEYFKMDDDLTLVRQDVQNSNLQPGDAVHLSPDLEKIMLFDAANGDLIYRKGHVKYKS